MDFDIFWTIFTVKTLRLAIKIAAGFLWLSG